MNSTPAANTVEPTLGRTWAGEDGEAPAHQCAMVMALMMAAVMLAVAPPAIAVWSMFDSPSLDRLAQSDLASPGGWVGLVAWPASGAYAVWLLLRRHPST